MNLLHLSTTDIVGGAAQAAYQINTLLRDIGHRSVMAVRKKVSSSSDVVPVGIKSMNRCTWDEAMERGRSRLAGGYKIKVNPPHMFNRNLAPVPAWDDVLETMPKPDVLFLHWITKLVTVADIRRLVNQVCCPVVWVLLDMEPMTGGCHYPGECKRFQTECRNCPQLENRGRRDWAARIWQEKMKQLSGLPITFLAPTRWLAEQLAQSGLFSSHAVENIPLPMSTRMKPFDKKIARQILGLPLDKSLILVGSSSLKDRRKGAEYLLEAACLLATQAGMEDVEFVIIGAHGTSLAEKIPFPVHDIGYQGDIVLPLVYQAADVFACSSVEDAGPMMVSQSMLCGTPVVAFNVGIVPELLASGEGGYMAEVRNSEDFASGLSKILVGTNLAGGYAVKNAACHHDPRRIAQAYDELLGRLFGMKK